ncbi:phosphoribosyltransferase family protein [Sphingobium sp. Ndbn-10]|uniref:phosphoribosyltransferase n=1 Tax=Sphingobium sp. Ndbn-10 TaxID=1667223 RepID=UPI0032E360DC
MHPVFRIGKGRCFLHHHGQAGMTDSNAIQFKRISYERFLEDIEAIAEQLEASNWRPDFIVGIGRGGLVPGTYLSHRTGLPLLSVDHSSKVHEFAEALLVHIASCSNRGERYLFVDDINDSGKTLAYLRSVLVDQGSADNVRFAVLIDNASSQERVDFAAQTIDRSTEKDWFIFPWGAVATREAWLEDAQQDPDRLGLAPPA